MELGKDDVIDLEDVRFNNDNSVDPKSIPDNFNVDFYVGEIGE